MSIDRKSLLTSMLDAMQAYFGVPEIPKYASSFEAILIVLLGQGGKQKNAMRLIAESKKYTHGELTPHSLLSLPKDVFSSIFDSTKKAGVLFPLLECIISLSNESDCKNNLSFLQNYSEYQLREIFLSLRGIGVETTENLLLYALNRPVFVPSRSIYRILYRHGLIFENIEHNELCEFFTDVLPKDTLLFKQYNMLLTKTARTFCKVGAPACQECPLKIFLEYDPIE